MLQYRKQETPGIKEREGHYCPNGNDAIVSISRLP